VVVDVAKRRPSSLRFGTFRCHFLFDTYFLCSL